MRDTGPRSNIRWHSAVLSQPFMSSFCGRRHSGLRQAFSGSKLIHPSLILYWTTSVGVSYCVQSPHRTLKDELAGLWGLTCRDTTIQTAQRGALSEQELGSCQLPTPAEVRWGHQNNWTGAGGQAWREKLLNRQRWTDSAGITTRSHSILSGQESPRGMRVAPDVGAGPFFPRCQGSLPQTASPRWKLNPPELLLYDDGCSASLPSLATLLITPVILLDQHSSAPALLKFFLFVVTSEFALDKDGSLCHLFIKCILQGDKNKHTVTTGATHAAVSSERAKGGGEGHKRLFPLYHPSLGSRFNHQRGRLGNLFTYLYPNALKY